MTLKISIKDGHEESPSNQNKEYNGPALKKDIITGKKDQSFEHLFSGVYKEYFQSLYNYGMQIAHDKDLVKDSIQEVFVELWKNQKTLKKVKFIKPYLFKSLKRKIVRELKNQKKKPFEPSFQFEISPEIKFIEDQQEIEKRERLNQAYKRLTERQREAIFFKYYEKLSYEDTSTALKISAKATYKLVARAISLLKSFLEE